MRSDIEYLVQLLTSRYPLARICLADLPVAEVLICRHRKAIRDLLQKPLYLLSSVTIRKL